MSSHVQEMMLPKTQLKLWLIGPVKAKNKTLKLKCVVCMSILIPLPPSISIHLLMKCVSPKSQLDSFLSLLGSLTFKLRNNKNSKIKLYVFDYIIHRLHETLGVIVWKWEKGEGRSVWKGSWLWSTQVRHWW